jgi:DNA-binding helix-hairpin-helix protein with protein kinase domain
VWQLPEANGFEPVRQLPEANGFEPAPDALPGGKLRFGGMSTSAISPAAGWKEGGAE